MAHKKSLLNCAYTFTFTQLNPNIERSDKPDSRRNKIIIMSQTFHEKL